MTDAPGKPGNGRVRTTVAKSGVLCYNVPAAAGKTRCAERSEKKQWK